MNDGATTSDSSLTFDIVIQDSCDVNTLTLVDTIEDKLYYIGDGPFEWSAIFTESKPGCTVSYELTETGMSAGLYTTDIFSVSTPGDTTANVITVDTADLATYDQTNKVLTLVISLPQNSGATSITISWTVYLQSECHSAQLTAPTFNAKYTLDLWDAHSIGFSDLGRNITKDCGSAQYSLKDQAGSLVTDIYSIVGTAIVGTPTDLANVGDSIYYVTAQDGSYNSIDSAQFEIYIYNPCWRTEFVLDHNINALSKISTTVKKPDPQETVTFDEFKDDESVTYGNGVDKCGARVYSIAHTDGVTDISGFLTLSGRTLTIATTDDSLAGTNYSITLTMSLTGDYANVTASVTFTAEIEPCVLISITPPAAPSNVYYIVGDAASTFSASSAYVQSPQCGYSLALTATGMPDPAVTFDGNDFTVSTNDAGKDGTYTITVVATFTDSPATIDSQVTFDVQIN